MQRSGFSFGGRRLYSLLSRIPAAIGILVLGAVGVVHAETALQAGEELTYSVRWVVLPGAGQIRIAASRHVMDGAPALNITTTTETRGFARTLLTFKANSESIFDVRTGRIVALHESSVTRSKNTDYSLKFDYKNRQA